MLGGWECGEAAPRSSGALMHGDRVWVVPRGTMTQREGEMTLSKDSFNCQRLLSHAEV